MYRSICDDSMARLHGSRRVMGLDNPVATDADAGR